MSKFLATLLPVVLAFLVGAVPALAWTWPVDGPVLEPFATAADPYSGGQHRGIDVGAPSGMPVLAPAGGVASFVGTVPDGGRTLTIQTEDGYAVTLLHLGGIEVAEGQAIAEGDPVATIGPSGVAEHPEPYVHLGIRVATDPNGYVDPLTLLPPPGAPRPEAAPAQPALADPAGGGPDAAATVTPPMPSPIVPAEEGTVAPPSTTGPDAQEGQVPPPQDVSVVLEPVEPAGPPEPVRPPEPVVSDPVTPAHTEIQTSPLASSVVESPAAATEGSPAPANGQNVAPTGMRTRATPSTSVDVLDGRAAAGPPASADERRSAKAKAREGRPDVPTGERVAEMPPHGGDVRVASPDGVPALSNARPVGDLGRGTGLPPAAWAGAGLLVVGTIVFLVRRRPRPRPAESRIDAPPDSPDLGGASEPSVEDDGVPEPTVLPVVIRPQPRPHARRGPERRPVVRRRGSVRASV